MVVPLTVMNTFKPLIAEHLFEIIMKTIPNSKYNHAEAFCVMSYKCESCGHEERVWNSRDGVTPFVVACPNCGKPTHKHVNWSDDVFSPLHSMTMKSGDRYFVDLTQVRAREIAAVRVDRMIEAGDLGPAQRNRIIAVAAASYFADGSQPDIAVKP